MLFRSPNLENVSLASNLLAQLRDLDPLSPAVGKSRADKKPKGWRNLKELVMTGNPLVQGGQQEDTYRRLVVVALVSTTGLIDSRPAERSHGGSPLFDNSTNNLSTRPSPSSRPSQPPKPFSPPVSRLLPSAISPRESGNLSSSPSASLAASSSQKERETLLPGFSQSESSQSVLPTRVPDGSLFQVLCRFRYRPTLPPFRLRDRKSVV